MQNDCDNKSLYFIDQLIVGFFFSILSFIHFMDVLWADFFDFYLAGILEISRWKYPNRIKMLNPKIKWWFSNYFYLCYHCSPTHTLFTVSNSTKNGPKKHIHWNRCISSVKILWKWFHQIYTSAFFNIYILMRFNSMQKKQRH